jgi:ADP-ribose pyrophosphatase YjhB (NUDIX family)
VTDEDAELARLPRWTRVAAYAVCLDQARRLLLVRVAPGYPATGKWTLPGGGLDFGEEPAHAVLRELTEETGLTGRLVSLAFVDSRTHGAMREAGRAYGPWHGIRIVYRVEVTGGDLRDEVDESTDTAEWVPLDQVRSFPIVDLVDAALDHLAIG